ncbi:hypothetical protein ACKKBF_B32915 [Auxenochlorella protothecoides x Auxenochlorella symbiontica]
MINTRLNQHHAMQEAAQLEALRQHLLMQKAQLEELQRMKDQFAEHERAQLKAMLGGMLAQQRQDHAVGVERCSQLWSCLPEISSCRDVLADCLAARFQPSLSMFSGCSGYLRESI